jgi:hypothetical protein
MSISTLQNKKKGLPTAVVYILGIIGVALIVYFGGEILRNLGNLKGRSSVLIESTPDESEVYINGTLMGKTTFQSQEIAPGENTIEIKNQTRQYQTSLTFLPNNKKYMHHVGINRDLGISDYFSAGNEFWFEKDNSGNILRIISEPSDATVYIDDTNVGKTPFLANNLTEGDYDLRVEYEGHESQGARIHVKSDYTLNITLKLFPAPVPAKATTLEGSSDIYDLSSENPVALADTQTWAKAVVYWNQTRGIDLKGVGVSRELLFDYFIDYKGNIFDNEGIIINDPEKLEEIQTSEKGAYLGKKQDGTGLSQEANEALETLMGMGLGTGKKAKVKPTGTGWLRVRSAPGITGQEVAKVDVGATYNVLEEGQGWTKIAASESVQGWVSSDYIEITE